MSNIKNVGTSTIDHSATQVDHTAHAAPPRVCSAESNRIEQDERNYASRSTGLGKETLTSKTRNLGEHQSLEVVCKGSASAEAIAGKGEGKLKITHREDGKFEVEVFNAFGVGQGTAGNNWMVGVAAGSKFVVATPEAAADLAHAIGSLEAVSIANTSTFMPFVMAADAVTGTSRSAIERLAKYGANLSEVKCDVRGSIEAELGHGGAKAGFTGTHAEAKLEGLVAREVSVNLEQGTARTAIRLEGKAEAEGTLDLSPGGAIMKQFSGRFGGKAEVKLSFRYEERVALPEALKARVASGGLAGAELVKALAALPVERVLVAEAEVEGKAMAGGSAVAKAKLSAEIPIEPGKILDRALAGHLEGLTQPLLDAQWEIEGELGAGAEMKVGLGVASVEASAMQWTGTSHHLGSLRECIDRAVEHFEDAGALHASLEHQRLTANLAVRG